MYGFPRLTLTPLCLCSLLCALLLQNFKLLRDKTGQTKIGDLSPLDMKKVSLLGHAVKTENCVRVHASS